MADNEKTPGSAPYIIGGMFALEIPPGPKLRQEASPLFLQNSTLFLATARSAFTLLYRHLKPRNVWVPSYLCDSVLSSFPGSSLRFFGVDESLKGENPDWIDDVVPGDMVVFIDYFGFNLWEGLGSRVREKNAYVIEDASHALLNLRFSKFAHYVICSPRKFLGVPDGGILIACGIAALPEVDLPCIPAAWWLEALKASEMRAQFDYAGGNREWYRHFRNTDSSAPSEPAQMSQLSEFILRNYDDFDKIAYRRRENFLHLAERLAPIALFSDLPNETVPLGFPVRIPHRDQIQKRYFEENIYPAVHWKIAGIIPDHFQASHSLASKTLTLPLDQRYSLEDMNRICSILHDII